MYTLKNTSHFLENFEIHFWKGRSERVKVKKKDLNPFRAADSIDGTLCWIFYRKERSLKFIKEGLCLVICKWHLKLFWKINMNWPVILVTIFHFNIFLFWYLHSFNSKGKKLTSFITCPLSKRNSMFLDTNRSQIFWFRWKGKKIGW